MTVPGKKDMKASAKQAGDPVEMAEGMIIKGVGGFYEVWLPGHDRSITCKAKGVFRREGLVPLAGDRVRIEAHRTEPGQGFIEELLPRKNLFVRPPVANMDRMAIVLSASTPAPDFHLTDKLLIACELRHILPLLLINKADAAEPGRVEELKAIYAPSGYPVITVSCRTGEGMAELGTLLAGSMTAFAGQSGVGKSTLMNALIAESHMATGELSDKIQRGKHTTRHAELLPMARSGWLCDTAGFSTYQLDTVEHGDLGLYYPEFDLEGINCRYQGCSHLKEQGCALQEKLDAGLIPKSRYETYAMFYAELKERHENRYK